MRATSKTGLLPASSKNERPTFMGPAIIEMPNLAIPAPFTLKPFAGIYNPFPYNCSVLCNHPTDTEARMVVQEIKNSLGSDGKPISNLEDNSALRFQRTLLHERMGLIETNANSEAAEDLFQNYSDSGSRPLTPAPTLASATTNKASQLKRRCLTPDPTLCIAPKEKTLLVLDLRRSHSQEIVNWQGDDMFELPEAPNDSAQKISSSSLQKYQKKALKQKSIQSSHTGSSFKSQSSRDSEFKFQGQYAPQSPQKNAGVMNQESVTAKTAEVNTSGAEVFKRRGKKRIFKKSRKIKEGDKEFKGIPDPGETQISALGNDSKEGSSRGSVAGEETEEPIQREEIIPKNTEIKNNEDSRRIKSFLQSTILRQLQRQLDQEAVESELNNKRKVALQEAMRHKNHKKQSHQENEIRRLKKEFETPEKNLEKWLLMPRVFTRRSARFELPLDSRLLIDMTPLEYVQKFVFPSPERLALYNHVFNLLKEEVDEDTENDREILGKNVVDGLGKVMGRSMTNKEIESFQTLIGWTNEESLNFRIFSGISATCERILASEFCAKLLSHEEDPRHEVERVDFETLNEKLIRLKPDKKLVHILKSIRDS